MESIPMDAQRLLDFLTDTETSLLSRGYFTLRLEEEFKKSWRYGWPLALIVFQVDGFDELASKEGDNAVRSAVLDISSELLAASRDTDLHARLQNDRFAIALTGTGEEGCRAFGERVLAGLNEGAFGRYRIRAGATVSPGEDLGNVEEFIARAETGLSSSTQDAEGLPLVIWNAPSR